MNINNVHLNIKKVDYNIYCELVEWWASMPLGRNAEYFIVSKGMKNLLAFGIKQEKESAEICVKILKLRQIKKTIKFCEKSIATYMAEQNIQVIILSIINCYITSKILEFLGFNKIVTYRNHCKIKEKIYDVVVFKKNM